LAALRLDGDTFNSAVYELANEVCVRVHDGQAPADVVDLFGPQKTASDCDWSLPQSPKEWAREFGVHVKTFIRWVRKGTIRAKRLSPKSYQIALGDVPTARRR
jgi:hypothetical protein